MSSCEFLQFLKPFINKVTRPRVHEDHPRDIDPNGRAKCLGSTLALPTELLIMVFESPGLDRKEWRVLSTVCKTWAWVAFLLLGRHVTLLNEGRLATFKSSFMTASTAAGLVRSLQILLDTQKGGIGVEDALDLLPKLVSLSELRLLWCGAEPSRVDDRMRMGLATASTTLTALYIDDQHFRSMQYSYLPYEILSLLPSLLVLRVTGAYTPDFLGGRVVVPRPTFRLQELTNPYPGWKSSIHWLMASSRTSLAVLDVGRAVPDDQFMRELAATHGGTLQSLAATFWTAPSHASILSEFVVLKELVLRAEPCAECVWVMPLSVRHIAFDYGRERTASSVKRMLERLMDLGVGPRFDTVTYNYAGLMGEIAEMEAFCASKGMRLRASHEAQPALMAQATMYERYASSLMYER